MDVEWCWTVLGYGGFLKYGGTPKWMVKIMENPIKMDDLGENPPFKETPIWENVVVLETSSTAHISLRKMLQDRTIWRCWEDLGTLHKPGVASKDLACWEMVKCSKFCCWLQPFTLVFLRTESQYFWYLYCEACPFHFGSLSALASNVLRGRFCSPSSRKLETLL